MAVLSLNKVSRRFGGVFAVQDFSMTARPGRITGLIGPNGAGKTTIVNLITGLLKLAAGSITLDGREIHELPPHEIARRGVARTFQNVRLLKEASVLDNILAGCRQEEAVPFYAQALGLPAMRRARGASIVRAHALLAELGMSEYANRLAGELSYGHQRRVEIMRALALEPGVLLLDEPVAGMNDPEAEELGRIFRKLAAGGMAVLLIEHNIRFVTAQCDEIYVLATGELIDHGAPGKVLANPKVVEAYLGARAMLTVRDLSAFYGGIVAVRGASLTVAAGKCVALIGSNGAGKTTLLNAICGALRPAAGNILFGETNITGEPAYRVARRGILLVPEGRQILGPLTVRENLELGRLALGSRRRGRRASLDAVFELFPRLAERVEQIAGSLSGGEQQMLAIGRALMGEPELLLLDEPSLGLAPIVVAAVFDALKRLNSSGLTILLVEQNARRALEIADYAYVMERGRIVEEGESSRLRTDPNIQSHYLGVASSLSPTAGG